MSAMFSEWIRIPIGEGFHEVMRTLSFIMSMFPGRGMFVNFIVRYFAFFASHDFLYSLLHIPLFGIFL